MDLFKPVYMVAAGGTAALLALVFQVLVGRRTIKFKGATHMKVHRGTAYTLVGLMFVHGLYAAAALVFGWV